MKSNKIYHYVKAIEKYSVHRMIYSNLLIRIHSGTYVHLERNRIVR